MTKEKSLSKDRLIKLEQAIAQTLSSNQSRTYTFQAALVLATIDDLGMKMVEK